MRPTTRQPAFSKGDAKPEAANTAVQAQAGHATIEATRIYLHLADEWLAS
jgi:integrase